jgi:hypothetical protein
MAREAASVSSTLDKKKKHQWLYNKKKLQKKFKKLQKGRSIFT